MAVNKVGSAKPKYLAATDAIVGDMSDTTYEFLLFNRPIVLLANDWLRKNYADVGIKTNLQGLEDAIQRSLDNPDEYRLEREYWLRKTIYLPDGHSSARCIDLILGKCYICSPKFVFIHGGDPVRKTNLSPMVKEVEKRGYDCQYVMSVKKYHGQDDIIYIAAHVLDLNIIDGYKVHFNHDPRGKGSHNLELEMKYYKDNNYFPLIDLHIAAGEVSEVTTKSILGSLADRAIVGGYPKSDDFIRLNTEDNKKAVYKEFGFKMGRPLITYASTGKVSEFKPGGSLSKEVINKLKEIANRNDYNLLLKYKYPRGIIFLHAIHKLRRIWAI